MIEIVGISILVLTVYCCLRAMHYITSWESLPVAESSNSANPLISILVPARNEEKSISKCLDSLSKQTYPNLEIIVIDDQSSDRTFEIIQEFTKKDPRIKLIPGKPLPGGWMGKCWALYQGTQIAKGEWFLFSDADVVHAPLTVNSVYQYAVKNDVDFLTLKYKLLVKSFWEKVIPSSINFAKSWFYPSPKKVNKMDTLAIEVKGDFVFVKRSIYEKLGDHYTVKDEIIESSALMRHFKKARHKVALLDGSHIIRVRKFHSFSDIVSSYSKLFYKSFQSRMNILLYFIYIFLLVALLSPLGYITFYLAFNFSVLNTKILFWSLSQIFILFAVAMFFYKKDNFKPWYALTFPLGAVLIMYIASKALFELIIEKRLSWRGRVY